MRVNIYDTPAQAVFIDTFVPIKFDKLYEIASTATKEKQAAEDLLDQISSVYGSLNTPSLYDKEIIRTRALDKVNAISTLAASDAEKLKDPSFRSKIRSLNRELASDAALKTAIQNIPNYNKYLSQLDDRWQGVERENVLNHNSETDGVFTKNPIAYASLGEIYAKSVDQMKESTEMTADGKYVVTGIKEQNIRDNIKSYHSFASADPRVKMHQMLYAKANNPMYAKYIKSSGKDSKYFDYNEWTEDAVFSEYKDMVHSKTDFSPLFLMKEKQKLENAAAREMYNLQKKDAETQTKVDQTRAILSSAAQSSASNHSVIIDDIKNKIKAIYLAAKGNTSHKSLTIGTEAMRDYEQIRKKKPEMFNAILAQVRAEEAKGKAQTLKAAIEERKANGEKLSSDDNLNLAKYEKEIEKQTSNYESNQGVIINEYNEISKSMLSGRKDFTMSFDKDRLERANTYVLSQQNADVFAEVMFGKENYKTTSNGMEINLKKVNPGVKMEVVKNGTFQEASGDSANAFSKLQSSGKLPSSVYTIASRVFSLAPGANAAKQSSIVYISKAAYDGALKSEYSDIEPYTKELDTQKLGTDDVEYYAIPVQMDGISASGIDEINYHIGTDAIFDKKNGAQFTSTK